MDVIARPYVSGGSHHLNKKPWDVWENPIIDEIRTSKQFDEYLSRHEEGSRFGIAIDYIDKTDHVIVGKIIDGKITLFDAQSGREVEAIDFNDIIDVKLWKTNNLELSDRGKTSCEGR